MFTLASHAQHPQTVTTGFHYGPGLAIGLANSNSSFSEPVQSMSAALN